MWPFGGESKKGVSPALQPHSKIPTGLRGAQGCGGSMGKAGFM